MAVSCGAGGRGSSTAGLIPGSSCVHVKVFPGRTQKPKVLRVGQVNDCFVNIEKCYKSEDCERSDRNRFIITVRLQFVYSWDTDGQTVQYSSVA